MEVSLINKNAQEIFPEHLNEKNPLPMQYLGGKGRIVNKILDSIEACFGVPEVFVDLFAGSGVVSLYAQSRGYKVIANDIQPYSHAVLSSLLAKPSRGLKKLVSEIESIVKERAYAGDRGIYLKEAFIEKTFINSLRENSFSWKKYKSFCINTRLCSGNLGDINNLKVNEKWTLFLSYYRNTYFGVQQCAEIDCIREYAEKLQPSLKNHLIAATISAMTQCVSSTTHLAQYLKPSTENNTKHLLIKRNNSIIEQVKENLKTLLNRTNQIEGMAYKFDFKEALEKIKLNSEAVVYADPPYFKEHYSRYYHVLDTFLLYDYPELTFNARIGKTTQGRYRENRIVSDFGKRRLAGNAFDALLESCNKYGNKLAISYANSSIVDKSFICNLAKKKKLRIETLEFDLVHSGQGQARHKQVKEYLFILSK